MNVYDGQRITAMLCAHGLTQTDSIDDADIIILNTCSVREKASNKVFSALGRIRKQKKPDAIFGIVGCVARESGGDAFRRIPELNFVLGPQSYHKLPQILENPDAKLLNIDLSGLEKFDELNNSTLQTPASTLAYIPIAEGCDHCCTYCIVPFTRGRELSRPFDDVMTDVRCAAANGAIEICFLGQNVNGYRAPAARQGSMFKVQSSIEHCTLNFEHSLSDLIRETAKIESVKRIRFTSSYPTNMSDDLIALFATESKLLPFLNMPIQSGSPDVLTRMNRPYSLNLYIDIIDKLRAAKPDIQISSDFIVGFPGETDTDFEMSCDIARQIGYINSYSFKYSPRPHTAAALMPDQIPDNIKRTRLKILDDILTENNRGFNETCVGRTLPCLCEGADKTGKNLIYRTPYMQPVIVENSKGAYNPPLQKRKFTSAIRC
jgi:tRNA-2-methylthio-N6-dimethylallyladenosine synthase